MSFIPTYHERNFKNLNNLAPKTKVAALKWYQYCIDKKIDILIYETIRTLETQKDYVKSGKSQTLNSYHLVGQALDFVPVKGKETLWNGYKDKKVKEVIAYAKKLGFEWGGDWDKFVDQPHLQFNYKGYDTDKSTVTKPQVKEDVPIVPYPGILKKGSKGKDVERIQRAVKVDVTGTFDVDTVAAVKVYQKRKNLEVDGVVGKKTWNMLF